MNLEIVESSERIVAFFWIIIKYISADEMNFHVVAFFI